jgi:serine phosphatase RsbU (regulator of sigma subunit)
MNGTEVHFNGALPLGLAEATSYEQTSLDMTVGDGIVMMTDGIVEAHDVQRRLLGFPRVEAMLRAGATAKNVVETAQQYGQDDDITVLRVARLS